MFSSHLWKVLLSTISSSFTPYISSLPHPLIVTGGYSERLIQEPACLLLPLSTLLCPALYVGARDLNSGPQACAENTLLIQPFPQPSENSITMTLRPPSFHHQPLYPHSSVLSDGWDVRDTPEVSQCLAFLMAIPRALHTSSPQL